jgi:hypothetical protein
MAASGYLTPRALPFSRATGGLCGMFANEKALSYAALLPLYHDHATYMARVEAHLKSEVAQRYLLPEDAARQLEDARGAKVP